jgi:cyclohexanone monooxygenase
MAHLRANGARTIEPREESETGWIAHVNEVAQGTMFTAPTCNSWYLGANVPGKARIFMPYVGGYPRYRARCEHEAANGYEGFALG